jgi:DNA-binding NarL/FixJ family response regulator
MVNRGARREDANVARRVLIVDDHARFRQTARRALERDGWTVAGEAADGAGGLDSAHAIEPDVVLVDVGLPDMSGLEVARRLRSALPHVAVVMISTQDSSDYRELAVANGALAFIPKAELNGAALGALLPG